MYNNIGEKVKTLAKVVAWLGIIGSIIGGIVLMVQGGKVSSYGSLMDSVGSTLTGTGITVMIGGSLISWFSSWGLYAIGDTNVKTTEMYNNRIHYLPSDYHISNAKSVCLKCGNQLEENELFCTMCGTKVEQNDIPVLFGQCQMCSKKNTTLYQINIVDAVGIHKKCLCSDCYKVYDAYECAR